MPSKMRYSLAYIQTVTLNAYICTHIKFLELSCVMSLHWHCQLGAMLQYFSVFNFPYA